jgi:uncharacterized metal-binding protein YceD (DUF177 family)
MTALEDWQHPVADSDDRTLTRTREATQDERIELARELDILSCESLRVSYTIKPAGAVRYKLAGKLEAAVTQACVVSVEPVPAQIAEEFSIDLAPPQDIAEAVDGDADREVLSLPDVEPIEDGRIDIGAIVFGLLSAALDPYPRAPGVEFDWVDPKIAADPGAASPFAALAKLKPKQ